MCQPREQLRRRLARVVVLSRMNGPAALNRAVPSVRPGPARLGRTAAPDERGAALVIYLCVSQRGGTTQRTALPKRAQPAPGVMVNRNTDIYREGTILSVRREPVDRGDPACAPG
jgi:hypothetical protein